MSEKKTNLKKVDFLMEMVDLQEYGTMISTAIINNRYEDLSWQPVLTKLLQSNKYKTFIDIGGGNGYFTVIAAKHCERVDVYEVSPLYYGQILYNIRFLFNVHAYYEFIGNEDTIPKTGEDTIRMITDVMEIPYNIKVRPLKKALNKEYPTPILVKIDIEGGELKALEGATPEQLQDTNIHWFIDVHGRYNISNEDVLEFFKGRDYELHPHGVFIK